MVISAIYIPLIFVTSPVAIVVLVVVGIVTELASRYVLGAAMQWAHGRGKHAGEKMFIPALSIEHLMERMAAFTILIVGESILNATYQASGNQYGPRSEYGRSALAIVIVSLSDLGLDERSSACFRADTWPNAPTRQPFFIMWLYFDADGSRTFVHALRRHWFPSITYTHIHFPLCAALILMSAALAKLVTAAGVGSEAGEISPGFLWFFGGRWVD